MDTTHLEPPQLKDLPHKAWLVLLDWIASGLKQVAYLFMVGFRAITSSGNETMGMVDRVWEGRGGIELLSAASPVKHECKKVFYLIDRQQPPLYRKCSRWQWPDSEWTLCFICYAICIEGYCI